MLETNIGEDYSVDPAVEEACATVVRAGCANERPGQRRLVLGTWTDCHVCVGITHVHWRLMIDIDVKTTRCKSHL